MKTHDSPAGRRVGYDFDPLPEDALDLVRDGRITPNDYVILAAFLRFARKHVESGWTTVSKIGEMTGLQERTVQRAVKKFADLQICGKPIMTRKEVPKPDPLDDRNRTGYRYEFPFVRGQGRVTPETPSDAGRVTPETPSDAGRVTPETPGGCQARRREGDSPDTQSRVIKPEGSKPEFDSIRRDEIGHEVRETSPRKKKARKDPVKTEAIDPADPSKPPFAQEDYRDALDVIFETFGPGSPLADELVRLWEREEPGLRGDPRLFLDAIQEAYLIHISPEKGPVKRAFPYIVRTWRGFEAGEKPTDRAIERTDRYFGVKDAMDRATFIRRWLIGLDLDIAKGGGVDAIVRRVANEIAGSQKYWRLSDAQKATHALWIRDEVQRRIEAARRPA